VRSPGTATSAAEEEPVEPQVVVEPWEGYIQCALATPVVVLVSCADGVTGTTGKYSFHHSTLGTPDWIQLELSYEPRPLTPALRLAVHQAGATVVEASDEGQSPVVLALDRVDILTMGLETGFVAGVYPPFEPAVVVDQAFQLYAIVFYGSTPPADWLYVRDGLPT
jgi:hypothetical protein